jgi:LPXTG-motif cell wall-anchored protein
MAGVLVFILFMWTPKTGRGVLIFVAILVGTLIAGALLLALKRRDTAGSKEL